MTFKSLLKLALKNKKWNCHHLHIDKSRTVTPELLKQSQQHMQEKWKLMRDIKFDYSHHTLSTRMLITIKQLVEQNCNSMRTFIDVDNIVGLTPMRVAVNQRNYWKKRGVKLQIGTQPLEGLETSENIDLFERMWIYKNLNGTKNDNA